MSMGSPLQALLLLRIQLCPIGDWRVWKTAAGVVQDQLVALCPLKRASPVYA